MNCRYAIDIRYRREQTIDVMLCWAGLRWSEVRCRLNGIGWSILFVGMCPDVIVVTLFGHFFSFFFPFPPFSFSKKLSQPSRRNVTDLQSNNKGVTKITTEIITPLSRLSRPRFGTLPVSSLLDYSGSGIPAGPEESQPPISMTVSG